MPMTTHNVSDGILQNIDKLLKKSKTKLSDLKGIFVIKGPGSFTGLRVGIAVANQFAHQPKIPIIGLRTDEWYKYRTDEKDFVYLQTMNRDEVYVVAYGDAEGPFSELERICNGLQRTNIISIAELQHLQRKSNSPIKWAGELSDAHHEKLSGFAEITNLRSPDGAWQKAAEEMFNQNYKKYNLIEPYYGKEPTITKGKK